MTSLRAVGCLVVVLVGAPVRADTKPACERLVAKVRLRADAGFRTHFADWTREADRLIAAANRSLAHVCLTLKPVAHLAWSAPHAEGLPAALRGLERDDRGEGVVWVLGLVTVTTENPASATHTVGLARPFGRHIVLNVHGVVAMGESVTSGVLISELLHALGHSLGAGHAARPADAPVDPPLGGAIDARDFVRLSREVLPARLAGDEAAHRAALAAYLGKELTARLAELSQLEREIGHDAGSERAAGYLAARVRLTVVDDLAAGRAALAGGRLDEAQRLANRLLRRAPTDSAVLALTCGAAILTLGRRDCSMAGDLDVQLAVLRALLARRDEKTALAIASDFERALVGSSPCQHAALAATWREVGRVDRAEAAARRAGAAGRSILEWAASERSRWAIPAGLDPALETKMLDALRAASRSIASKRYAAAAEALVLLERELGDEVVGARVVRCELYLARGDDEQAAMWCRRAIALAPDAGWAHFLLGRIQERGRQLDAAVASYERAVAVMPAVIEPWRSLARLYRQTGRRRQLRELSVEFAAAYGTAL